MSPEVLISLLSKLKCIPIWKFEFKYVPSWNSNWLHLGTLKLKICKKLHILVLDLYQLPFLNSFSWLPFPIADLWVQLQNIPNSGLFTSEHVRVNYSQCHFLKICLKISSEVPIRVFPKITNNTKLAFLPTTSFFLFPLLNLL